MSGDFVKVVKLEQNWLICERRARFLGLSKLKSRDDGEHSILLKEGDRGIVLDGTWGVGLVGIYVPRLDEDFIVNISGLEQTGDKAEAPVAIMQQLWASRAQTFDVILIAAGAEEVPVHACILVAASPVFAAALRSGMKETASRKIQVAETPKDIVEGTLAILYTGMEHSKLDIDQVLSFVHKYHIVEVAKYIAPMIIDGLKVEHAAQVVRLLRDFDASSGSQTQFIKSILAKYKDKTHFMQAILMHL